MHHTYLYLSICFLVLCGESPSALAESPPRVDFSRQIRPILSNNCFKCHGPDEAERKAGLRLDQREAALRPAESGAAAIVPGNIGGSELVARIVASNADELMPPPASNKKLAAEEIQILKQWVAEGADYKLHWSYVAPRRVPLPSVSNSGWIRTGIDAFILQKLEAAKLALAPEADRATLIRRLSFDLTGLPPTPAEVDAFLADSDPQAYEHVVDRLLASPHFGERMAQEWLDLARYGDTNGYENDSDRSISKYRDWVIAAFNRNLPFDQFTIEQIAGDLLPNATLEQRIATGFHRNVTYNEEGGADPDEYMVKYAVDRTSTTASVFLGMTMACAECHDHKYDPVSQKDFYSLFAFFNSVDGEKGAQGHDVPLPPLLSFPTPEQDQGLQETRKQLADLDANIQRELAQVAEKAVEAPTEVTGPAGQAWDYVWVDDALPTGATPQGSEALKSWQWGELPAFQVSSRKLSHVSVAKGFSQHYFTGADHGLRIGDGDTLYTQVFLDPKDPPKTLVLQFNDGSWEHRAYWGENLVPWGMDGTVSRLSLGQLPTTGGWVRLEVPAQKVGIKPRAVVTGISFGQVDGRVYWDQMGLTTQTPQALRPQDAQAAWETFERGTPNPPSKLPGPVREAVVMAPDKRTDAQKGELRNYFLRFVSQNTRAVFDPLNQQADQLKSAETKLLNAIPTTMVMSEMKERRPAHVLMRGNYLVPGERVAPATPAVLPPLPSGAPANRLGLAQWLVSRENPLVSRVAVNRFWKQFFGTGIVKTLEDFGSQGEFPVHPELLDWLAVEFMGPESREHRAWDVKRLVRQIVTSSTYRQVSTVHGAPVGIDPHNRLLARSARFRLSAESIRDNALAISGLLNAELGGKSVFPYQPADYYADKGRWKWPQSTGRDLYRRGLYTFWRRTTFYPSFQVFDAPTREFCTIDRPRTNTPLQALVTLNDPVFVEASRVLGQRILQEGGDSDAQKLSFALRLCVARPPSEKEQALLTKLLGEQRELYRKDTKAAESLVNNGAAPRPATLDNVELAAWTAIGNVLLNLDETLTRE